MTTGLPSRTKALVDRAERVGFKPTDPVYQVKSLAVVRPCATYSPAFTPLGLQRTGDSDSETKPQYCRYLRDPERSVAEIA